MFVLSIKTFLFGSRRAVYCLAHVAEKMIGLEMLTLLSRDRGLRDLQRGLCPNRAPLALQLNGKGSIHIRTATAHRGVLSCHKRKEADMKMEATSPSISRMMQPTGRKPDRCNKKYFKRSLNLFSCFLFFLF